MNQKDNKSLLDYSKRLKKGDDIWKRASVNVY